ncbi:phage baseplate assembly protein V [Cupriavidus sp. IK-TO18]|uniref:phage baseplate assembly protein V n=1 Tax=Pseudomonadota TaxID=1224 RepID=UPI001896B713|nr:phage baseplate assembly protein V [Cupriavidus sp. IK-TO18]MBF6992726.1 phage baseplate assembly protein V [Cupriavidus sp. IK-TO18]
MSVHKALRSIFERLQEHERRLAGSNWTGKVKEVDPAKKLVRIVLGKDDDGHEVLSPWMPYAQTAGALKVHNPPSVGQVMTISSEAGDLEQGRAHPFHWSDDNPSPSDSGDEHVMTFGSVTVTLTAGGLKLEVGGTVLEVGAGKIGMLADLIDTRGGALQHNDKNVGSTHVHGGVIKGGQHTEEPAG